MDYRGGERFILKYWLVNFEFGNSRPACTIVASAIQLDILQTTSKQTSQHLLCQVKKLEAHGNQGEKFYTNAAG